MNSEDFTNQSNKTKLRSILDFKHFVIIQTAFLGDTTLTFYLCQFIKNYFAKNNKECQITFVTLPAWYDLVKEIKSIDNIILYDKKNLHKSIFSTLKIASEINTLNPDCVISPHKSFRTSLLVKFINTNYKIGFNNASFKFVYDFKAIYNKNNHEIIRILSLLNGFYEFFDKKFSNKNLKDLNNVEIKDIIEYNSLEPNNKHSYNFIKNNLPKKKYIVIAPGSVWATKKWSPKYYSELIDLIINKYPDYKIIITGGKSDITTANEIMTFLNNQNILVLNNKDIAKNDVINLTNQTSLDLSLFLFSNSILTITNDSAPTHISELVNTNVLTIYGPTSPEFGFSPRLNNSAYIQLENLNCKPCHIHGKNICPIGTHDCMNKLTPTMVFEKVNEILVEIMDKDKNVN